jgi:hypothetical protein
MDVSTMHKENLCKDALLSAKHDYDCHFDDSALPLRRNLLFVSILSFASLNVAPKDGDYSINLGVISGVVEKPEYIFIGLLCVCLYHLYMFWVKCRHTIINSINYPKIKSIYMFRLSSLHAFNDWHLLLNEHVPKGVNVGVGCFTQGTNQTSSGGFWKVKTSVHSTRLQPEVNFKKALESNPNFQLKESEGSYEIEYLFKESFDDYKYLNIHRDHFWLTKRSQFIENVLPILLGFTSIILVLNKVSSMW